jgi:arylsulfatase A-like enzyme
MKPMRLFFFAVLALAALQPAAWSDPLPRRPSIILVVADGLGAGDLSCYGQTEFQTPHLDKLAAGGIRFTNYLAGGVADSPALAALMIGKNTSYLPGMDFSLTAGDIAVAQVLHNSGYRTCLIGEWNLGDQNSDGAPWRHGFEQFAGSFDRADAQVPYPISEWRYSPRRTDVYNGPETVYGNANGRNAQYTSDLLTLWAGNYVKKSQPDMFNHYQPFFLMLHYSIPGNGNCAVPSDAPFSEEPWPQPEKNRAAAIARLDSNIAQLLDGLDKSGETSNTIVFFTSGVAPQKSGGIDPKFFHENSSPDDLHVPLIVSCPGKIPAGQVTGVECSARDFLSTAAALALVPSPGKVDGASFASALFGQSQK